MSDAPFRLALLKSDEPEFQSIASLFGRHTSSLELVHGLTEAAELARSSGPRLQGILFPLRIRQGLTGISACLQAKAHPTLSLIPAVALCPRKDLAIAEAFYGAGADAVFTLPFDPDQLLSQTAALARIYQVVHERTNEERDRVVLSSASIRALDAVLDPLVVFDANAQPTFANVAAKRLLGISAEHALSQSSSLFTSLQGPLKGLLERGAPALSVEEETLAVETEVVSFSKQRIPVRATLVLLRGATGSSLGVSALLQSVAELEDLQQAVLSAQRAHALALLSSAGMLKLLEHHHGGYPLAPIQRMVTLSQQEEPRCRLAPVLTALIEILDSIVAPGLSITLKVGGDAEHMDLAIAMRPSDALQLFGHIVLHAARTAGIDGEVAIATHVESNANASEVLLLFTAEQGPSRSLITRDMVSECTHRRAAGAGARSTKLLVGLDAAQSFADRYGIRIEFKTTPTSVKVRLRLPVCSPGTLAQSS